MAATITHLIILYETQTKDVPQDDASENRTDAKRYCLLAGCASGRSIQDGVTPSLTERGPDHCPGIDLRRTRPVLAERDRTSSPHAYTTPG